MSAAPLWDEAIDGPLDDTAAQAAVDAAARAARAQRLGVVDIWGPVPGVAAAAAAATPSAPVVTSVPASEASQRRMRPARRPAPVGPLVVVDKRPHRPVAMTRAQEREMERQNRMLDNAFGLTRRDLAAKGGWTVLGIVVGGLTGLGGGLLADAVAHWGILGAMAVAQVVTLLVIAATIATVWGE